MKKNFIIEVGMPFEFKRFYVVDGETVDLSGWGAQLSCYTEREGQGSRIFSYDHKDYALTLSDDGQVQIEISEDDTINFPETTGYYELWMIDPNEEKTLWMSGSIAFI